MNLHKIHIHSCHKDMSHVSRHNHESCNASEHSWAMQQKRMSEMSTYIIGPTLMTRACVHSWWGTHMTRVTHLIGWTPITFASPWLDGPRDLISRHFSNVSFVGMLHGEFNNRMLIFENVIDVLSTCSRHALVLECVHGSGVLCASGCASEWGCETLHACVLDMFSSIHLIHRFSYIRFAKPLCDMTHHDLRHDSLMSDSPLVTWYTLWVKRSKSIGLQMYEVCDTCNIYDACAVIHVVYYVYQKPLCDMTHHDLRHDSLMSDRPHVSWLDMWHMDQRYEARDTCNIHVTHLMSHGSVLQCVAVCCSVLQCVAVCCSVLQCDASDESRHSYDQLYRIHQ